MSDTLRLGKCSCGEPATRALSNGRACCAHPACVVYLHSLRGVDTGVMHGPADITTYTARLSRLLVGYAWTIA